MADPAKQPPKARRVHAACIVIGDDLRLATYAQRGHRLREGRAVRQRMAPVAPRLGAAERIFQMHVGRARDMPGVVMAAPRLRIRQVKAAVQDQAVVPPRWRHRAGQFLRGDQGVVHTRFPIQAWPAANASIARSEYT
ncbi:hypothetical protein G6F31_017181 [Rhizopus arrhizus]|nr:hypothetical protein G6F31_017181 [Rhizopus arrhizus]